VVYRISNNSYVGGDQPKRYRLVVFRYLLFMRAELVEIAILEILVLGV
jgi:hypothetical protein